MWLVLPAKGARRETAPGGADRASKKKRESEINNNKKTRNAFRCLSALSLIPLCHFPGEPPPGNAGVSRFSQRAPMPLGNYRATPRPQGVKMRQCGARRSEQKGETEKKHAPRLLNGGGEERERERKSESLRKTESQCQPPRCRAPRPHSHCCPRLGGRGSAPCTKGATGEDALPPNQGCFGASRFTFLLLWWTECVEVGRGRNNRDFFSFHRFFFFCK